MKTNGKPMKTETKKKLNCKQSASDNNTLLLIIYLGGYRELSETNITYETEAPMLQSACWENL